MKKRIAGGALAILGFLLSPLSWWNDLFINIPLAYVFALPFGFVSRSLFLPAMIFGYWLTNVLGFVCMHHGVKIAAQSEATKRELKKDILFSLGYTVLISVLIAFGVIRFPSEYFSST